MKTLSILFISIFFFLSAAANHISVNENKVVHIVCPKAVSYVQVGNGEKLIAETLSDYPNIVRVKASNVFKDTTSLSLVCDGKLYTFDVGYQKDCPLQYKLSSFKGQPILDIYGTSLPLDKILEGMKQLGQRKIRRSIEKVNAQQIQFSLTDIKVKHNLLFVEIHIKNNSNIIYITGVPTFLMRDKKPKKAANVQEYLIEPEHASHGELSIVPNDEATIVMVFKTFTIPKHKEVEVSLKEITNGYTGRDLKLNFSNKPIVRAKSL
ncbi:DUF4138 domain-containing protein [Saccharicrinis sp. GN24d3]|uniref:DUF4138 domain-containing protein n=1 Tax=Saccharicrinis sp. GN24d3 TaxID=3458416 RepID=UPI004034FC55